MNRTNGSYPQSRHTPHGGSENPTQRKVPANTRRAHELSRLAQGRRLHERDAQTTPKQTTWECSTRIRGGLVWLVCVRHVDRAPLLQLVRLERLRVASFLLIEAFRSLEQPRDELLRRNSLLIRNVTAKNPKCNRQKTGEVPRCGK